MEYHIEKVASPNAEVGEGPVWNAEEKKVYWTDIAGGKLFKYDPDSGTNETIHTVSYTHLTLPTILLV